MNKITQLFLLLFVFTSLDLSAQKSLKPFAAQELKKGDLGNKKFKDFPESTARILFDYGVLTFTPNGEEFRIEIRRHLRVKFLKDTLITAHTLGLSYFEKDEIASLSHFSIVNGDLQKKDIKDQWEELNLYALLSSEIENLHSGDILEFEFKAGIESPADVPGWQFEYEIPVDYSEWYSEIPGMFSYRPSFKGYVEFAVNSSELLKDNKNKWIEIGGFYIYINRYVCIDIAPFKKVIYSPSSKNYLTTVDFYLEKVKAYKSYKEMNGQTWEQVSSQLYKEEKLFGRTKVFKADDLLTTFALDSNQDRTILLIYNWLKSEMTWNGEIGIFAENPLDQVLAKREGSIAEINLLLCALLDQAGINASPVILRSIDQGEVNMELPGSSQFNYLITLVDLKGFQVLLDASDPCLDVNLLRPICLNQKGLKISPRFEEWIELEEDRVAKVKIVTQTSVQNNKLVSVVNVSKLNYFAFEDCKDFNDINDLIHIEPGVVVSDVELSKQDSVLTGNRIFFNADLSSIVDKSGSTWTFKPFWIDPIQSSPFVEKSRKFPIVFPYLFEYNWNFVFNFSDNISVIDFPRSQEISVPDKSIRFAYQVTPLDGVLQINAQFVILQRRFGAGIYDDLIDFYEAMEKLFNEEIKIKVKAK
jgi:hypothetical protein